MLFPEPGTTTGGFTGAAGLDELLADAMSSRRLCVPAYRWQL